jgi:5'-nucleotidase
MKRSLAPFLFLLAFGCATAPSKPVQVVVVGTTDVHGWFAGHVETPQAGGEGVLWGGLPALASYVEALRDQNARNVIVVDSGDMFQGTLESNLFEGEAVVRGYNIIGYTAAAVGNHEFDFGPVGPDSVARKPGEDPLGALKRNAQLAMFPLLSANMLDRATQKTPTWARPYTMVRVGGAKIGIIGLSTPDTPNVTTAANVISLQFTDPIPATIAAAKALREQGADAVIVIAHMGGRCTDVSNPNDTHSCEVSHEAMEFMDRIPEGVIDAFFAGHTHSQMRHYMKGIPVVQALHYSREFSTVDFWIDTKNNKVTKSEIRPHTMICTFVYSGTEQCDPKKAPAGARLVPRVFAEQRILPDTRVANAIDPYLKQVAAKREQKLGIHIAAPFTRNYLAESSLGDLIADALRAANNADIGIMNSGGIRDELPTGELTYAHVFAVSPFDNYPALVMLTGAQITEILRATSNGVRGIMQVSGLRYTIDASKPVGSDRLVSVTRADGSPLGADTLYSVVMPDFVASGGDGADVVMKNVPRDRVQVLYAQPIREVLIEQLRKLPQPLAPKTEERITILNAPAPQKQP